MLLLAYAVAALFGGGRKDEGGKAEGGKAEGGKAPSPPFLPGRIGERLVSTDAELQAAVGDPAISLVTFAVERIELSQTLELQHDVTLVGPVVLDAGAEPSPSLCGDTFLIMVGAASFVEQRVVAVHEGVNAALVNLTITRGMATDGGGGVLNHGELTITGATITGNSASRKGGGLLAKNGGMRKADAKAEASMVNRAIKKVKLFAITRDFYLRLRGRVREAKLSVDAPAPAPSPPVFELKGVHASSTAAEDEAPPPPQPSARRHRSEGHRRHRQGSGEAAESGHHGEHRRHSRHKSTHAHDDRHRSMHAHDDDEVRHTSRRRRKKRETAGATAV